jgi:hypothetical protein
VATHPGVLHVFAEARHNSCNDASMHSLAYARSSDGGATFSPVSASGLRRQEGHPARGREPRPHGPMAPWPHAGLTRPPSPLGQQLQAPLNPLRRWGPPLLTRFLTPARESRAPPPS